MEQGLSNVTGLIGVSHANWTGQSMAAKILQTHLKSVATIPSVTLLPFLDALEYSQFVELLVNLD